MIPLHFTSEVCRPKLDISESIVCCVSENRRKRGDKEALLSLLLLLPVNTCYCIKKVTYITYGYHDHVELFFFPPSLRTFPSLQQILIVDIFCAINKEEGKTAAFRGNYSLPFCCVCLLARFRSCKKPSLTKSRRRSNWHGWLLRRILLRIMAKRLENIERQFVPWRKWEIGFRKKEHAHCSLKRYTFATKGCLRTNFDIHKHSFKSIDSGSNCWKACSLRWGKFSATKIEYESKLRHSGRLVVGGGPSTASRPPARAPPTQPAAPTTTSPAVHVTPSTLTAVPPPWKTHNLTPPVSPSPITNAGPTQTIFFVEEEIHFSVSSPQHIFFVVLT